MSARLIVSCFLAIVIPVTWISLVACTTIDAQEIEERLETARTFWAGWTGRSLVLVWPPEGKASFDLNDHQKSCRNWRPIPTTGKNLKLQCCNCDVAILIGRLWTRGGLISGPGLKGISLESGQNGQFLMIGTWPLCAASVLLSLPFILVCYSKARLRFRIRKCLCLSCGYCLFGNESGICPECGKTIEVNATSQRAIAT